MAEKGAYRWVVQEFSGPFSSQRLPEIRSVSQDAAHRHHGIDPYLDLLFAEVGILLKALHYAHVQVGVRPERPLHPPHMGACRQAGLCTAPVWKTFLIIPEMRIHICRDKTGM